MTKIFEKMESIEDLLLKSLLIFYKNDSQHLEDLAMISKQKTIISLREMDFLTTNYSKNNKVSYELSSGKMFKLHLDYKVQLRGYSKRRFDPFCRRARIFLDFETKTPIDLKKNEEEEYKLREDGVVTTIGQLNFFRWAINNKVVEYCFNNKEDIDEEMEKNDKKKKEKKKREREEREEREEKELKKNVTKERKNIGERKIIIQFP